MHQSVVPVLHLPKSFKQMSNATCKVETVWVRDYTVSVAMVLSRRMGLLLANTVLLEVGVHHATDTDIN